MTTSSLNGSGSTTSPQVTTTTQSATTTMNPNGALGKNAFLQLLVAQMKNQDPLQPKDNSQMVAQLAQFSSLEQMTNINSTETKVLSAINSLQTVMSMAYEHQMIGTNVTVDDGQGNKVSGQVSSIQFNQGTPEVVVNGNAYPMTQVVSMS